MTKIVLIVFVLAIAALLIYARSRPDTLRVERKAVIAAPPAKLYGLINDLHQFNRWNPYLAKDPALKASYEGPSAGPGASYGWEGNKDVGQGSMTITANTADQQVVMRLLFIKPFPGDNTLEFTLTPQGDATEVSWLMHGPQAFVPKLLGIFVNMDQMIGRDFETGLVNLRRVAETT
jgi:uncharacterized protein YndB with AHSA1/START domain